MTVSPCFPQRKWPRCLSDWATIHKRPYFNLYFNHWPWSPNKLQLYRVIFPEHIIRRSFFHLTHCFRKKYSSLEKHDWWRHSAVLAGGIRSCKDTVRTVDREASVAADACRTQEFLSTWQTRHMERKKESQLNNYLHQTVLWACRWSIFLVNDRGGQAQHCGWSWVVKESGLSTRHEPVSSTCHGFLPLLLLEVLPWLWSGHVSQIRPSLPRLLLVAVFITQWKQEHL